MKHFVTFVLSSRYDVVRQGATYRSVKAVICSKLTLPKKKFNYCLEFGNPSEARTFANSFNNHGYFPHLGKRSRKTSSLFVQSNSKVIWCHMDYYAKHSYLDYGEVNKNGETFDAGHFWQANIL